MGTIRTSVFIFPPRNRRAMVQSLFFNRTVWRFGCQTTQHNELKFEDESRGSGSLVFGQTVCHFPVPVEQQIFGFGDNSLHGSTSVEPQNSNPALHLPFAGREASICCTIHSPLGVVIHVKGNQWSMSDIFFFSCSISY